MFQSNQSWFFQPSTQHFTSIFMTKFRGEQVAVDSSPWNFLSGHKFVTHHVQLRQSWIWNMALNKKEVTMFHVALLRYLNFVLW